MPTGRKQISTAIKTILEGVSGIGNILEFHRYTRSPEGFREHFTKLVSLEQQKVNVWLITRDSFDQRTEGMPIGQEMRTHTFVIRGYIGLRDATGSEETFQDLLDEIVNTLESRIKLGVSEVVEYVHPPIVPTVGHAWLGSAGCHYGEVQLRVLERRSIAYVP